MDALPSCRDEQRRADVRLAPRYGIDYLEVSDDRQQTLAVHFLGKAPATIAVANVRIGGGQRIRDIRVTHINMLRQEDPTLDDVMEVTVDRAGDFSTYTLSLVELDDEGRPTGQPMSGFDRRYSSIAFSFKASCPDGLDCKTGPACAPAPRVEPDINYLAKDYASLRQLMLDRLALIMPGWQEAHAADLGIALVELLAYTGDYLSYYQDAVATEAYLGTARQRISVRRHARLVDYRMHDGCNARAWLCLQTDAILSLAPRSVAFLTAWPGAPRGRHIVTAQDLVNVPAGSYEVFEPLLPDGAETIDVRPAHNELHFYTWGNRECCLARGATSATLRDDWAGGAGETGERMLRLKVGDVLVFEEVIGPVTGNPADADPAHRQAVRLTGVVADIDPLYQQPVVTISWGAEDALRFPLCLSSKAPPACQVIDNVSVARGNVILVDHGSSVGEVVGVVPLASTQQGCPGPCEPAEAALAARRFRPRLQQQPLTFSQPLPAHASACALLAQQARESLPALVLDSIDPAPDGTRPLFSFDDLRDPRSLALSLHEAGDQAAQALLARLARPTREALAAWDPATPLPAALQAALVAELSAQLQAWRAAADLLDSADGERVVVVETDNAGDGHLRFAERPGEGALVPPPGMQFAARYRVGNGRAGNVGAEAIAYLLLRGETISGAEVTPRNPLPACGGLDPETLDEARMHAPSAFRTTLARAITADDYAQLAMRHPGVQRAAATLRWTGSWTEVLVAIDPLGSVEADPALLDAIAAELMPYRRVGHDLVVRGAQYVALDVELRVCVQPHYLRGHVEAALRDALGNRVLADGTLGFFHPDRLTFGRGIQASALVAAAQAVPGVLEVDLVKLERYFEGPNDEVRNGVLALGPTEIARMDNNPGLPENGRLVLDMRGGR